jgi:hypothetical protein
VLRLTTARGWTLAAADYTGEALETMVELIRSAESEAVRLMAAGAIGKAPMTVDITALRHEIVYHTPEEILKALIEERGVPPILIEHMRDGSGGRRVHAGRPPNVVRAAQDRRSFALAAADYTGEALETMVELMRSACATQTASSWESEYQQSPIIVGGGVLPIG